MTPEDVFTSTQTALARLALSGCTASDHLYLFPTVPDSTMKSKARARSACACTPPRLNEFRSESQGGLPPDSVVDTEEQILKDSQRLIRNLSRPKSGLQTSNCARPCSPFSVTGELMRQSAVMARHYRVHLHTHLAETEDEDDFCLAKFGHKPVAYMQSVDWIGDDVWFAHSVHVNKEEINLYATHGCGVAHCPSSNMRLASGIAPVMHMLSRGVKLGLGVDGSASNDSSHLLAEVRQAMLLARLHSGVMGASRSAPDAPPLMTARQALSIATRGRQRARPQGYRLARSRQMRRFLCHQSQSARLRRCASRPGCRGCFLRATQADYTVVGGEIVSTMGDQRLRYRKTHH